MNLGSRKAQIIIALGWIALFALCCLVWFNLPQTIHYYPPIPVRST